MTYDRDFMAPCDRCKTLMPSPDHRRWGLCEKCRPASAPPLDLAAIWARAWELAPDLEPRVEVIGIYGVKPHDPDACVGKAVAWLTNRFGYVSIENGTDDCWVCAENPDMARHFERGPTIHHALAAAVEAVADNDSNLKRSF